MVGDGRQTSVDGSYDVIFFMDCKGGFESFPHIWITLDLFLVKRELNGNAEEIVTNLVYGWNNGGHLEDLLEVIHSKV